MATDGLLRRDWDPLDPGNGAALELT